MSRSLHSLAVLAAAVLLGCPAKPPPGEPSATPSASAPPSASVSAASAADAAPLGDDASAAPSATASAGDASTTTTTASGGGITVDESMAGKTIDLAKGQKITVALKWRPSSGYDWSVTKSPAALGTPEASVVSAGDVPGAAGQRRFTFTVKDAIPAGEQPVEFAYARDFEKGKPPARTFAFKVRAAK
ncbi:MAG TPA: protease inhibitor I42 family protein [Labilithrix sp.]